MKYILLKDNKYVAEGNNKNIIDSYEYDIFLDTHEWTLNKCSNRSFNTLKQWELIPDNNKIIFKRTK